MFLKPYNNTGSLHNLKTAASFIFFMCFVIRNSIEYYKRGKV